MNYPVWQLDFAGGGLLIAMIAIIHVYVAQFAVGGGLFLVLTEMKGVREKNSDIIAYVKSHTRFFMLLTMVFGAVTGVGIWFTISLLNPAATSVLIHTFVFAWAIEWLFFMAEIVSLFIYYYTFDRLDSSTHIKIGWIYFGCAWMSLFMINGIIDFMLTPGGWLQSGSFWAGFFNPTFWPALFFRSFFSVIIAGLFGFLTAACLKDARLRLTLVRFCAKWLLAPFVFFIGAAWWYKAALPAHVQEVIFQKSPELEPFMAAFLYCSPLIVIGGLLMAVKLPTVIGKRLAAVMLVIGLVYFGAFEFVREGGRRPYIIYDHMYSTSILKKDMEKVARTGVLQQAKWVEHKEIRDDNRLEAGKELFDLLCLPCHSFGGPFNDMRPLAARTSPGELELIMSTMGRQRAYMPPFAGTEEEKQAIIYFLSNMPTD
jgi:cytochrome bd-type quinol oxidase subunit 1